MAIGTNPAPFTISFWIKFSDFVPGTDTIIFNKDTEYKLVIGQTLKFFMYDYNNGGHIFASTNYYPFTDGQWYHVAITFNGTSNANGILIYINGSLNVMEQNTVGTFNKMEVSSNMFYIGNSYLSATLDCFGIFRVALVQAQIQALINKANSGQELI